MSLTTTVLLIAGLLALAAILTWVFRGRFRGSGGSASAVTGSDAADRGPRMTKIEFYTDFPVPGEAVKSET